MEAKKFSVTIGISAYNEQEHIQSLLNSILNQKETLFRIERITVVSDASTDNTDSILKSIDDPRITLIRNTVREGQIFSQNRIFKLSDTDFVVLFEADTRPSDSLYIHRMISAMIRFPEAGMIQGLPVPAKPETMIECILATQANMYSQTVLHSDRKTELLCAGQGGRVFSRRVYKKLRWPKNVPEDTYALLWCFSNNILVLIENEARCNFRSSRTVSDYLIANNKVSSGKKTLEKYFSKSDIDRIYSVPRWILVKITAHFILTQPVFFVFYLIFKTRLKLFPFNTNFTDFWPSVKNKKYI